jgi:hypothetical protein
MDQVSFTLLDSTYKNVSDFIPKIQEPDEYPHVAIYYPQNVDFQSYDVIVVYFHSPENRETFGYRLKKSKYPLVDAETTFTRSLVVGAQTQAVQVEKRGWTIVHTSRIENFYGNSGAHWTPESWMKLLHSESGR